MGFLISIMVWGMMILTLPAVRRQSERALKKLLKNRRICSAREIRQDYFSAMGIYIEALQVRI